jgi:hypothetical protein
MFNVVVGVAWQVSLMALPIYIVIQETTPMLVTLGVLIITSIILKISWWDRLDEAATIDIEYVPPEVGAVPETGLGLAGTKQ